MISRRKTKVKKINKKKGFSLVELLVVVSIVLVLTGLGTYTISRFTQTHQTAELKEYLVDRVKLANSLSTTNQLPDKTTDLKYVKVTILNKVLTVEAIKNDGIGTTESPYFSETLDDKNASLVTLTNNSVSVNSFGFWSKTGKLTDGDGNLSDGPLVIKISNNAGEYSLTVNALGVVQ